MKQQLRQNDKEPKRLKQHRDKETENRLKLLYENVLLKKI